MAAPSNSPRSVPLSILDLAIVNSGEAIADAFRNVVAVAQLAERCGYRRIWYAEHHNMASIASSATSVLIAHVAAHTSSIRLGAGGIMLPNHSPLAIAEQFGTLETLHPGRIDLGLGRAPGSDQPTMRALRRDARSSDRFPADVLELQAFLSDHSAIEGVKATPGAGTNLPLYLLGSSLFGAQLAAHLGLPYAFASHFAPDSLVEAVELYRREFQPSAQLSKPYVIAAASVIVADEDGDAAAQRELVVRSRVALFLGGGRELAEEEIDRLLLSPQGRQVQHMMKYSVAGQPAVVSEYLESFASLAHADELIIVCASPTIAQRLRSIELLADEWGLQPREAATN